MSEQTEAQTKALADQQKVEQRILDLLTNLQRTLLDDVIPADQRQIAIHFVEQLRSPKNTGDL